MIPCSAVQILPILMGLTVFVIVIFIIQTGNKNKTWDTPFATWKAVVRSLGLGAFFMLLVGLLVVPSLRRRINRDHAALNQYVPLPLHAHDPLRLQCCMVAMAYPVPTTYVTMLLADFIIGSMPAAWMTR